MRYSTLARPRHGEILAPLIDDWLDQAFIIPTDVMASRALLQSVGGFEDGLPTPGHVDYGLWLKLALRGTRFDYLDEPLALYYRGHPSVSSDAVEMVERHRVALQYFSATYDFPDGGAGTDRTGARDGATRRSPWSCSSSVASARRCLTCVAAACATSRARAACS